MKRFSLATLVGLIPAAASAQTARSPISPNTTKGTNVTSTMTMQQGLTMSATDSDLRPTMKAFLEAAGANKAYKVTEMISAKMRMNAGAPAVSNFIESQLMPFFGGNNGLGNSVTIANTTDGFGQQGLAYYAYLKCVDGEIRPFVMYVVIEGGEPKVANVLVNKFVEGRHK